MMRFWLFVMGLLLLLAGCAVPYSTRDQAPPRVHCLYEPTGGTREPRDRPLIFFLCIEAP